LGNRLAALNSEWLCDNGITHIMNVTKDIQNYYLDERYPEDFDNSHPTAHVLVEEPEDESDESKQTDTTDDTSEAQTTAQDQVTDSEKTEENSRIRYRRFAIEDSRDEEVPFEEIEAAVRFVQSAHIGNDGRALIHCREGKSRSVTILLCYLMTAKRWPLQRAFNHVKERAPWINVNEGFLKLLMDIDLRLFNTNSIDFFDKQERKERIDYCELDFDEEERSRRRTSTRGKKSNAEKRGTEVASDNTESVKLESAPLETANADVVSSTQVSVESVAPAVKEDSTAAPSSSASELTSVAMETDTAHTEVERASQLVASETITVATSTVSEVTPVPSNTVAEHVPAVKEELTTSSVEKIDVVEQTKVGEEHEDKENSGDVQNVGSTVLGKRKREKPESKESPAKKKKKVDTTLPKVNIMSFFKRVE
jgi:protein-tyrosine phosphatase